MGLYKKGFNGDPIPLHMGHYIDADPDDKDANIIIRDSELLRFACCDCGMVHTMAMVLEEKGKHKPLLVPKTVILHMWSEPRRTAQLRRHGYGGLQRGAIGQWRMTKI